MSEMDFAPLTVPVSDDDASGPSLEEESAHLLVQEAYRELVGESVAPMVGNVSNLPPHGEQSGRWKDFARQTADYLRTSKHIEVAIYYLIAQLRLGGLLSLRIGLSAFFQLMERQWATLYPRGEDETDTLEDRRSAIETLCDQPVVKILRKTPLIESKEGRFSLADIAAFEDAGEEGNLNHIRSVIQELSDEAREALRQDVEEIGRYLEEVEKAFNARVGEAPVERLDLGPIREVHAVLVGKLSDLGMTVASSSPHLSETEEDTDEPAAGRIEKRGGIQNREDVVRLLNEVCGYYEKQEPGSPVPLLLHRAIRMVRMNFQEICQELTLNSSSNLDMIFGKEENKTS